MKGFQKQSSLGLKKKKRKKEDLLLEDKSDQKMKLCRAVLVRRDGLGWAGATGSVRAQSHLAGLEGKGTKLSKHGWEAGGAGPASPRVPPVPGPFQSPGLLTRQ